MPKKKNMTKDKLGGIIYNCISEQEIEISHTAAECLALIPGIEKLLDSEKLITNENKLPNVLGWNPYYHGGRHVQKYRTPQKREIFKYLSPWINIPDMPHMMSGTALFSLYKYCEKKANMNTDSR